MSTVVKNPLILNSANYIYNWFISINHKNDNLIKKANLLEAIECDEIVLSNLDKNIENEERYNDIDKRLEEAKKRVGLDG